ncbi:MAG: 3',5'-cyclic-AMP phosphodiesterase [Congregibacter sp.]
MTNSGNSYCQLSVRGETIRVLQLTDTHLKAHSGGTLLGLDTDYSLRAVIDIAQSQFPEPDLLLGTGDLADSGSGDAYQRLISYFDQLTPHHYWLPGNHDLRDVMIDVAGNERLPRELRAGNWQIIMLDSQIPGEVGGHLGSVELEELDKCLAAGQEAGLHTLVCMHHQPVPVGCDWLDEQMVSDARDFFAVVERYPQVRGVLWGHVHQQLDRPHGDMQLMCTPSTCVQFLPEQVDFAVDTVAPGYRWMELHPDGRIGTAVVRADSEEFTVDREAGGYL